VVLRKKDAQNTQKNPQIPVECILPIMKVGEKPGYGIWRPINPQAGDRLMKIRQTLAGHNFSKNRSLYSRNFRKRKAIENIFDRCSLTPLSA
jgi:hypothetical protein